MKTQFAASARRCLPVNNRKADPPARRNWLGHDDDGGFAFQREFDHPISRGELRRPVPFFPELNQRVHEKNNAQAI